MVRSKGFFWIASRPAEMMLWSQAGDLLYCLHLVLPLAATIILPVIILPMILSYDAMVTSR